MFRSISAIVLLTAFAIQSFNRAFIVLDYYTNTAAFAKNCENKDSPQKNCNGKCLMMKKLKEVEKKEQRVPERKLEIKNDVVSSRSFFTSFIPPGTIFPFNYNLFVIEKPALGFIHSIFHPPSLV